MRQDLDCAAGRGERGPARRRHECSSGAGGGTTPRVGRRCPLASSTSCSSAARHCGTTSGARLTTAQAPGQFILTGSSTPTDDITRHSGAGRFARIDMRPMTLYEMGYSSGEVSISGLLAGEVIACPDPGLGVVELLSASRSEGGRRTDSAMSTLRCNKTGLSHQRSGSRRADNSRRSQRPVEARSPSCVARTQRCHRSQHQRACA